MCTQLTPPTSEKQSLGQILLSTTGAAAAFSILKHAKSFYVGVDASHVHKVVEGQSPFAGSSNRSGGCSFSCEF